MGISKLSTDEKIRIMTDMKATILDYLSGQLDIHTHALKAYEADTLDKFDQEIRKMREVEAIKLRDRMYELSRHIAVIKQM